METPSGKTSDGARCATDGPNSIMKMQLHSENPIDIERLVIFCGDKTHVERLIKEYLYHALLSDDHKHKHFFRLPHLRHDGRKDHDTIYGLTKITLEDLSHCMFGYLFRDLMETFDTIFHEDSDHSMRDEKWKKALVDYTKSNPIVETGNETFMDYMVSNVKDADDIMQYESILNEVFCAKLFVFSEFSKTFRSALKARHLSNVVAVSSTAGAGGKATLAGGESTVTVGSTDSATGGGAFTLTSGTASDGAGGINGIEAGASDGSGSPAAGGTAGDSSALASPMANNATSNQVADNGIDAGASDRSGSPAPGGTAGDSSPMANNATSNQVADNGTENPREEETADQHSNNEDDRDQQAHVLSPVANIVYLQAYQPIHIRQRDLNYLQKRGFSRNPKQIRREVEGVVLEVAKATKDGHLPSFSVAPTKDSENTISYHKTISLIYPYYFNFAQFNTIWEINLNNEWCDLSEIALDKFEVDETKLSVRHKNLIPTNLRLCHDEDEIFENETLVSQHNELQVELQKVAENAKKPTKRKRVASESKSALAKNMKRTDPIAHFYSCTRNAEVDMTKFQNLREERPSMTPFSELGLEYELAEGESVMINMSFFGKVHRNPKRVPGYAMKKINVNNVKTDYIDVYTTGDEEWSTLLGLNSLYENIKGKGMIEKDEDFCCHFCLIGKIENFYKDAVKMQVVETILPSATHLEILKKALLTQYNTNDHISDNCGDHSIFDTHTSVTIPLEFIFSIENSLCIRSTHVGDQVFIPISKSLLMRHKFVAKDTASTTTYSAPIYRLESRTPSSVLLYDDKKIANERKKHIINLPQVAHTRRKPGVTGLKCDYHAIRVWQLLEEHVSSCAEVIPGIWDHRNYSADRLTSTLSPLIGAVTFSIAKMVIKNQGLPLFTNFAGQATGGVLMEKATFIQKLQNTLLSIVNSWGEVVNNFDWNTMTSTTKEMQFLILSIFLNRNPIIPNFFSKENGINIKLHHDTTLKSLFNDEINEKSRE